MFEIIYTYNFIERNPIIIIMMSNNIMVAAVDMIGTPMVTSCDVFSAPTAVDVIQGKQSDTVKPPIKDTPY